MKNRAVRIGSEVLLVEVVSEDRQVFNGEKYYRRKDGKYYVKARNDGERYLHRAVFAWHEGPIPKGLHIHHKDHDQTNNQYSNLEALSRYARRAGQLKGLEAGRDKAIEWHKSEEGMGWHRKRGDAMTGVPKNKSVPCVCKYCQKEFLSVRSSDFCSRNCKTAERYHSGIDHEERSCGECGGPFRANKYSSTSFCSRSCAAIHRARARA